jgi:transposase
MFAMDTATAPRRAYSPEFKLQIIEACKRPQTSISDIASSHGINPELVRRWIWQSRAARAADQHRPAPHFVPVCLDEPGPSARTLQIEVRRGSTLIKINCPVDAANACTDWLTAWLQ